MTVIATDDFSGDLSAYTQVHTTSASIVSGALQGVGSAETGVIRSAESFSSNQYSQFVVKSLTGVQYFSSSVRNTGTAAAGTLDCYRGSVGTSAGDTYISRVDNATATDLTSGTTSLALNDTLKTDVSGTTITLYRNGASILSTTDATYSTGKPGIELYNDAIVDDAEFGDDSSGAIELPQLAMAPLAPPARPPRFR